MLELFTVSFFQLALIFFKHLNIRLIVARKVSLSMLTTLVIQVSWLLSSAIGINAYLNHNWLIVSAYLIFGVLGNYLNFKLKI